MRPLALLSMTVLATIGMAASAFAGGRQVDVDVIASGLDNPRHVAVGSDGDVYVAEAGKGGPETPDASCFDSAEGFSCTGDSGAVTKILRHHRHFHQDRIVEGLASFAPPGPGPEAGHSAIGPHGIFVKGNDVYVTNGGPTAPTRDGEVVLRDPTLVEEDPVSALYGTLLEVHRRGRLSQIADIWAFENEFNPDEELGNELVDSNPVDVLATHGRFVVADAGGNSILRVSRRGEIEVVAIFPNVTVPNPFPPPPPAPQTVDMNAVPTGVVSGRDGAYYVSQLTGFPFPVGGASIFRVDPRSGEYTTYASGFTNIMDLDFGRDGTLYVLEIRHDSLLSDNPEGGLWAVPRGGGTPRQIELPADTLIEPGGIAVGRDGDLYVSNHAREPGAGEVLEIELGRR